MIKLHSDLIGYKMYFSNNSFANDHVGERTFFVFAFLTALLLKPIDILSSPTSLSNHNTSVFDDDSDFDNE